MTRLLLVDDNASVRLALSALLEEEGYVVETAASFADAARRLAAGLPGFGMALLDMHLGDGLGTDLIPLFRARSSRTKLVLLSGSDGELCPASGADLCLGKGGDIGELLDSLRSLDPSLVASEGEV